MNGRGDAAWERLTLHNFMEAYSAGGNKSVSVKIFVRCVRFLVWICTKAFMLFGELGQKTGEGLTLRLEPFLELDKTALFSVLYNANYD
jgi:hypothetical protein